MLQTLLKLHSGKRQVVVHDACMTWLGHGLCTCSQACPRAQVLLPTCMLRQAPECLPPAAPSGGRGRGQAAPAAADATNTSMRSSCVVRNTCGGNTNNKHDLRGPLRNNPEQPEHLQGLSSAQLGGNRQCVNWWS
jgi:hypothetical protein